MKPKIVLELSAMDIWKDYSKYIQNIQLLNERVKAKNDLKSIIKDKKYLKSFKEDQIIQLRLFDENIENFDFELKIRRK